MVTEYQLSQREFRQLREIIYEKSGINLSDQKVPLVKGRLSKRLRTLGLKSFQQYCERLQSPDHGTDELVCLIDAISTNVTSFFREQSQWTFLKQRIDAMAQSPVNGRGLRIWSAACSSGEEPYSLAIFLHENLHPACIDKCRILATDISPDILRRAKAGVYRASQTKGLSGALLQRYFTRQKGTRDHEEDQYRINPQLREMILFRSFNLVYGNYAIFRQPMDAIFCRNVMIYFDTDTRTRLVTELARLLPPGGLLFLGHSESISRVTNLYRMVQPSIYERI